MATGIAFGWQVENSSGTPVSGAKVYIYRQGTTTAQTAYTDSAIAVPAANPIISDSAGWFNAYLNPALDYTVVIKSADDAITYQTRDYFSALVGTGSTEAVGFGFVADGLKASAAANTVALQAALDADYWVTLPEGTAYIRQITHTQANRLSGVGIGKTVLILDDSQNTRAFYAASLSAMVYEDFTLDMSPANNTGSGAHDGIRLETCVSSIVRRVRVTGARGLFSGSPVGAGLSLLNGSGVRLEQCQFDDCYDGAIASGHTDGLDIGSKYLNNQRFGGVFSTGCHRWRDYGITATGNSSVYDTGGGYLNIDSDDCESYGAYVSNSTLAMGRQFQGSDRFKCYGGRFDDNAIDGLGVFDSLNGRIYGGSADGNAYRAISIDSASNGTMVYGFHGTNSGDVDLHQFRSVNVEWINCTGTFARISDAGILQSATVAAGGSGYTDGTHTVRLAGGTAGPDSVAGGRATLSVTVSGGAATAVSVVQGGDHWVLPSEPASVTGLPGGGAGATFNLVWAGENSDTCADTNFMGGGLDMTLAADGGFTSRSLRLSNWLGTLTDNESALASASGCPSVGVPVITASLQNSWTATTRAVYYKDADGIVHVEGRIEGGTVAPNTILFTLDAGFRPANTEYYLLAISGGSGFVYVDTDGAVRDLGGSLNATWSSLNGISFRAA